MTGTVAQVMTVDAQSEPYRIAGDNGALDIVRSVNSGMLHLLWKIGSPYFGTADRIMYAQYDLDTGQQRHRSLVHTSPVDWYLFRTRIKATKDNSRVNIIFGEASTIDPSQIWFTQLNAATGQTVIPPMALNANEERQYRANPEITMDRADRPYIAWEEWISGSGPRTYARIYRPEISPDPRPGRNNPIPGSQTIYFLHAPLNSGDSYIAAAAFSTSPATPLPGGINMPLALDPLFFLSLTGSFITNSRGQLDPVGISTMNVQIPQNAPVGTVFYLAFITFNNQGEITSVSAPLHVQVAQP